MIKCDEYEIERCIVNLVSNAAKFTPEGGTIEVTIKDLDEKVMIIVKDTGIGIDKKYMTQYLIDLIKLLTKMWNLKVVVD